MSIFDFFPADPRFDYLRQYEPKNDERNSSAADLSHFNTASSPYVPAFKSTFVEEKTFDLHDKAVQEIHCALVFLEAGITKRAGESLIRAALLLEMMGAENAPKLSEKGLSLIEVGDSFGKEKNRRP